MKIDVAKAILDYLRSKKKISIPGIGSFEASPSKSEFKLGDQQISAPKNEKAEVKFSRKKL